MARLQRQPSHVLLRFVPADARHRMAPGLYVPWSPPVAARWGSPVSARSATGFGCIRYGLGEGAELLHGHLESTEGYFGTWQGHHLRADVAVSEHLAWSLSAGRCCGGQDRTRHKPPARVPFDHFATPRHGGPMLQLARLRQDLRALGRWDWVDLPGHTCRVATKRNLRVLARNSASPSPPIGARRRRLPPPGEPCERGFPSATKPLYFIFIMIRTRVQCCSDRTTGCRYGSGFRSPSILGPRQQPRLHGLTSRTQPVLPRGLEDD